MLNTTPTTFLAPRQLSWTFLAKNKLPPRTRARLAAEVLEHRAVVTKLTVGQIASLCRVSVSSVNARAKRPQPQTGRVHARQDVGPGDTGATSRIHSSCRT
jgi:hypothetical protein